MPNAVVEDWVAERAQHLNTVTVLAEQARARGKDPSDDEIETVEKCKGRIRKLDELIGTFGDNLEMADDMADRLARLQPGLAPTAPKYRSAGELAWDAIHASFGNPRDRDDQEAKVRYDLVMKRAAEHMGTSAAETTPVAGGMGGLYVVPVVGPVIDLGTKGRPFLNAMGVTSAPSSLAFIRPRIVDPNFDTGAAEQALQKSELVSKHFDVAIDNLSMHTVGGYLNVSQQLLSFGAGALDLIIRQLQRRVAWASERAAIDELNNSTAHVPLAPDADAATVLEALFEGAQLVYTNTQELPTWLAYGPAGWAMLGSLTDTAQRPLFPFLGATNAMGTSSLGEFSLGPLGLRQILTPAITDTSLWMGNSSAFEAYGYSFPILEAVEPSLLGRQVAVAEALAFYRPTTKEAVGGGTPSPAEGNGAVRIGP